jgi:tRNA U34 2-thiouridine synthase MnmA/TrmU
VGPETALFKTKAVLSNVHRILPPDFASGRKFDAKIRYRSQASPVEVFPLVDKRVEVTFNLPQRAITQAKLLSSIAETRCTAAAGSESASGN